MPQSLSNTLVHLVYSTKHRARVLTPEIRAELFPYMAAILKDFGCPPLQVGGWEDHTHSLFQLGRTRCLADVVKKLKTGTTTWMKGRWPGMDGFSWQIGYGGLPVGGSEVQRIRRYIERQDEHHFKVSFQDEYRALLREAGIDFDENYLWD